MSGPHADARHTLATWLPSYDDQVALRDRFLAYLDGHPDGLLRTCRPHHLTASVPLLSPDGTQVLLTLHRLAGAWFQVGGHIEPGDVTLVAAAAREAAEESGLEGISLDPVPVQLDVHPVPFCGEGVHHLDVRFVAVAEPRPPTVSDESHDVRWWPTDALPSDEPSLQRLVDLARVRVLGTR